MLYLAVWDVVQEPYHTDPIWQICLRMACRRDSNRKTGSTVDLVGHGLHGADHGLDRASHDLDGADHCLDREGHCPDRADHGLDRADHGLDRADHGFRSCRSGSRSCSLCRSGIFLP